MPALRIAYKCLQEYWLKMAQIAYIYIYMLNPIRKIACACNNINQNHFGWQNPAKYAITYLPKLRMRVETLTCYT